MSKHNQNLCQVQAGISIGQCEVSFDEESCGLGGPEPNIFDISSERYYSVPICVLVSISVPISMLHFALNKPNALHFFSIRLIANII